MSKTISTTGDPEDLDGTIVDRSESLSQRIRCVFRFRLGEWFYNIDEGLDFDILLRHNINANQAAQILLRAIRDEGDTEITNIRNIEFENDPRTRRFVFNCDVDTIYGDTIVIRQEI